MKQLFNFITETGMKDLLQITISAVLLLVFFYFLLVFFVQLMINVQQSIWR